MSNVLINIGMLILAIVIVFGILVLSDYLRRIREELGAIRSLMKMHYDKLYPEDNYISKTITIKFDNDICDYYQNISTTDENERGMGL